MAKYIKKPVAVEAIKWTGRNRTEVDEFLDGNGYTKGNYVDIGTLEGLMVASVGDMIIRGIKGEFYPCREDIFKATYYTEQEYAELK